MTVTHLPLCKLVLLHVSALRLALHCTKVQQASITLLIGPLNVSLHGHFDIIKTRNGNSANVILIRCRHKKNQILVHKDYVLDKH